MFANVVIVIALEVPIARLVKVNDDGYDLAHAQSTFAQTLFAAFTE
jgi:hypothetical protein